MTPRVVIVGTVSRSGFRVRESYFCVGRRVMNRLRWLQVRQACGNARPQEAE